MAAPSTAPVASTGSGASGLRFGAAALPWLVLLALGYKALADQGFFLVDDAYITFRYARNLALGHGLVWNPGEPVEGYTNLLWVLLLTPFAMLRIDLLGSAIALGALAACGCLELLRRIARQLWPESSPLVHALPALLLASNPSFAYWAVQGMETPLFALLVLLAGHLLIQARRTAGEPSAPGRRCRVGLVLCAAYLTRPEGLLVAAILLAIELACASGSLRARLSSVLAPSLMLGAVVGIHLALRLHFYGELLPNTFHAKVIFGWLSVERGGHHLLKFLLAGGLLALPGLCLLFRRGLLRSYLAQGYLLFLIYTLYLVVIGGDYPWWFRFYVPLLPLPLLGLAGLLLAIGRALGSRLGGAAARLRPFGVVFALLLVVPATLWTWPRAEAELSPVVRHTGKHLRGLILFFFNKLPPESYIAANAVGMVGYYTDLRILDAWGLNDHAIAHRKLPPDTQAVFGHDKTDWNYVFERLPDFVFAYRPWYFPFPSVVAGYQACWHTYQIPHVLLYRRGFPLRPEQRSLGMPAGTKERPLLPPRCDVP